MWEDKDQEDLPAPYNANSALTDAMAAGSLENSRHIMSINPVLSLMDEAKLIASICDKLDPDAGQTQGSGFESIQTQALSVAEALTLNSSVQGASSKSKAKPL